MYVSGEIAGNPSLRSEPAMDILFDIFARIDEKYGERFDDTFMDQLDELALNITNEKFERIRQELARIQQMKMKAPPELKSSLPLDQGATSSGLHKVCNWFIIVSSTDCDFHSGQLPSMNRATI